MSCLKQQFPHSSSRPHEFYRLIIFLYLIKQKRKLTQLLNTLQRHSAACLDFIFSFVVSQISILYGFR